MPYHPVMAVGTAMIAAHPVSFFITMFRWESCKDRFVSKMESTMSRSESVHSAARITWS